MYVYIYIYTFYRCEYIGNVDEELWDINCKVNHRTSNQRGWQSMTFIRSLSKKEDIGFKC